jgi:lysozyme
MVNAEDWDAAKEQILRWNKAGGRVLRGLTLRRMAEASLL